ncbi:MAG: Holliday junction branch migration protein RuvA [Bdellovibrionaceae bacterium]|nr:Holliday junction branch migration protein RuvA [Bdellovibrionales bacterium]MCB9255442.1 Holliday junction branch migration protein RuvA [Pseudobdellovibrionaceae bacterium]
MIGFLRGKLLSKNPETLQCVVLAQDVGYELTLHKKLFLSLTPDADVSLFVHTHMKESVFAFYGFNSEEEKQFFRVLLSVSGLGPKSALSLLGEHGAQPLAQLILQKNAAEISRAPGIGKKTAERIVLELRAKVEKLAWLSKIQDSLSVGTENEEPSLSQSLREDLSLALVHLGYQPNQFKQTLDSFCEKEDLEKVSFEAALKRLLADLSGRIAGKHLSN